MFHFYYLQLTFKPLVGMFLHSKALLPDGDLTRIFDIAIFLHTDELPQITDPTQGSCFFDVVPEKSLMTIFDNANDVGCCRHLAKSFCA
jgi:hypothetical protein